MKLLIAGSRSLTDVPISQYVPKDTTLILTGGAVGVDTLAERYADERRISKLILRPRYDLYGKAAPIKRNEILANNCDRALIFWDGKSKGTTSTIKYIKKLGKEVQVVMAEPKPSAEGKKCENSFPLIDHIKELCAQKNITYYKLANASGIPHSSFNAMINRQELPSMNNFLKICGGFGITPAEFFLTITPSELRLEMLRLWARMNESDRRLALAYIHGLTEKSAKN